MGESSIDKQHFKSSEQIPASIWFEGFRVQWGSTRKGKGGPIGKGPQNAALRFIGGKHTQAPTHGLSWLSCYRRNSYRWLHRSHIGHSISNNKSFNAYVIGWYRSFSQGWLWLGMWSMLTSKLDPPEPVNHCLPNAVQLFVLSLWVRVVHTAWPSGHSGWPFSLSNSWT